MTRVSAFIDGFNLYHSINNDRFSRYKWLNFRKLIELFLRTSDTISDIYYFTALANWNRDKVERHKLFIRVLKFLGIKIVYGQFKKDSKPCEKCGNPHRTHTEKETDVNIAVTLFEHAILNSYDRAIILSGDSDQIPIIRTLKKHYKHKEIGILTPPGSHTKALIAVADFHHKIDEKHLSASRLPDEVVLAKGTVIKCPDSWK